MSASSRTLTFATVLAISGSLLAAPGCIIVSDDDGDADGYITIFNDSDTLFIDDVRLAPIGTSSFGPNQVPEGIAVGESVEFGVDCDFYDLRLTDLEADVECLVTDIDLCLRDAEVSFGENSCSIINVNGTGTDKPGVVKKGEGKTGAAAPDASSTQI
jgi:hypothetical protein